MSYYIEFPGITGNVTKGEYKGWFEAPSVSFGATPPGGRRSDRGSGTVTEIQVTLKAGSGSAELMRAATTGSSFPKVTIILERETNDGETTIFEIELKSVLIVSFNMSGPATISLNLDFEKSEASHRGGPPQVRLSPVKLKRP